MTLDHLLNQLETVRKTPTGWKAKCPAHVDHDASLRIERLDDGAHVVLCDGCGAAQDQIESALTDVGRNGPAPSGEHLASHEKRDWFRRGGVIFDLPSRPPALWGSGSEVLAARGEPTLIYSSTGLGKSTIVQRVVLTAIGAVAGPFLGYDVEPISGNVLYLAADRPSQAMRSMRRMVDPDAADLLNSRLFWDSQHHTRILTGQPDIVFNSADAVGADLVVMDSIKDLVDTSSHDESGQAYNSAVQYCVARGIEVIALHHPRKSSGEGRSRLGLDDVYGSTWITAGAGSVIALEGAPGSGLAILRHLKAPADEVGPLHLTFDYATGSVAASSETTLVDLIRAKGGATTTELGIHRYGTDRMTDAQSKKLRREMRGLEEEGYVGRKDGPGGVAVWIPV